MGVGHTKVSGVTCRRMAAPGLGCRDTFVGTELAKFCLGCTNRLNTPLTLHVLYVNKCMTMIIVASSELRFSFVKL